MWNRALGEFWGKTNYSFYHRKWFQVISGLGTTLDHTFGSGKVWEPITWETIWYLERYDFVYMYMCFSMCVYKCQSSTSAIFLSCSTHYLLRWVHSLNLVLTYCLDWLSNELWVSGCLHSPFCHGRVRVTHTQTTSSFLNMDLKIRIQILMFVCWQVLYQLSHYPSLITFNVVVWRWAFIVHIASTFWLNCSNIPCWKKIFQ